MKVKNTSSSEIFYSTLNCILGPNEEKTVTAAEGEMFISNPYVVEVVEKKPVKKQ